MHAMYDLLVGMNVFNTAVLLYRYQLVESESLLKVRVLAGYADSASS